MIRFAPSLSNAAPPPEASAMPIRYRHAPAAPADTDRPAVLLVNLGTPDAPTPAAVRRYLSEFLHDWRVVDLNRWLWCPVLHGLILPRRAPKVARTYAAIWREDGSPLLALSRRLAEGLQAALPEASVRLAMRYGNPSVPAVLRELHETGIGRLIVLPLYPQYSATTSASVFDAVTKELAGWRRVPALDFIADYHLDAGWVAAVADSIRAHRAAHGGGERLLFSFHGIPQRFADAGDPYPAQCRASAQAIAAALGLRDDQWRLAYQSRFGREPWLQPYTDRTLDALAREGVKRVDVVCPGFAVDCIETLEEIAVENADVFRRAGGEALGYIPCLNDDPAHVAALAALLKPRLR